MLSTLSWWWKLDWQGLPRLFFCYYFLPWDLPIWLWVEITDAIAFEVDRTASYKEYNLLHSIPRSYNPSGMHNSDQYLLTVYAPAGSGQAVDMDAYWAALATAADVALESY